MTPDLVLFDCEDVARAKAASMRAFGHVVDTGPARLGFICDALFDDMTKLPKLLHLHHAAVVQS
ncbi:MAG: hypothetical protein GY767_06940 [Shimia sp.]|nr:hypothetical protein [Shimia sp.]MCP4822605.1 hypothetical protein [Shimia sp.]